MVWLSRLFLTMVSNRYLQDQAIFRAAAPSCTFLTPGSHGHWDFPKQGMYPDHLLIVRLALSAPNLPNPPLNTLASARSQAQYPQSLSAEMKREEICFFQQRKAEKLGLCVREKQGADTSVGAQGMSMETGSGEG